MQFNRDGLNIPDELVRRQKQGNVVFLCGAGVSVGSGMPNFDGLKQFVIDELGADNAPDTQFDELFSWLEGRYPRARINTIIAKRLTSTDTTPTNHHKIIAKLSRDIDGKAHIVTTNFDVLFEKAIDDAKIYEPPTLPQIHWDASISGITYLHGRLNSKKYVLSEGDFGEAYLSEGWATNFLRELIRKYTVVLCGYGANDVLVKYLFQGGKGRGDLYAFASFENEKEKEIVEKRWKNLGIHPILYLEDDGHSHLWKALEAWTQYKPEVAIKEYAYLPHPLPRHLQSQVCEAVKTPEGAKDFADLDPPIPANWINVFDERGVLQWIESDGNPMKDYQYFFGSTPNMPPRLFHLSRWMAKHVTSPIVVGWLVKNRHYPFHPRLISLLSYNVEEAQKAKNMPSSFEKVWDFLFTCFEQRSQWTFFHLSSDDFLPPSGEQINWDDYLASIRKHLIRMKEYPKKEFINHFDKIKEGSSYWIECLKEKEPEPTFVVTGGSFGENTDYQALMNIPIAQVIEKANETPKDPNWHEDTFCVLRPFAGLVRNEPRRAILALVLAARKGEDCGDFWADAVNRWNYDETTSRVTSFFHEHLRRLPDHIIHSLMQPALGRWVMDRLPQIAKQDEHYALAIFDDLLKHFPTASSEKTKSSMRNVSGHPNILYGNAINAPFGHITEGLLKIFAAQNREEKSGMPSEFARRFEQLLQALGNGSCHVVCILTRHSSYLYYIAPDWTRERLFPLFQLDNKRSESAWNGLLHSSSLPHPDMFQQLKSDFLKLFEKMGEEWKWMDVCKDVYKSACWWVSALCFYYEKEGVFSYQDAKSCIKNMSPLGASHVLHQLKHDMKENGCYRFALDFIKNAWIQRLDYQSEETMSAFIDILEEAGLAESNEHFPQFLDAVKWLLGEMKSPWLYGFYEGRGDDPITKRFPRETLQLLAIIVGDNLHNAPQELEKILDLIIEGEPSLADDRRYKRLRDLEATL